MIYKEMIILYLMDAAAYENEYIIIRIGVTVCVRASESACV